MNSYGIDIETERLLYTNGDTISGVVRLSLSKDVQFKALDLKLCCRENFMLSVTASYSAISNLPVKRKVVTETARIIGDSEDKQTHILQPGVYCFPFSLVIPKYRDAWLGSSEKTSDEWVRWYIKLVIRRPKSKRNIRIFKPIILEKLQSVGIVPPTVFQVHNDKKSYSTRPPNYRPRSLCGLIRGPQKQPVQLDLSTHVPEIFYLGQKVNYVKMSLLCTHPEMVNLDWIEIKVNECWSVDLNQNENHFTRVHQIHKGPLIGMQSHDNVTELNDVNVNLPDSLAANFERRKSDVEYFLVVRARISFPHSMRCKKDLEIEAKINVQDEFLPTYSQHDPMLVGVDQKLPHPHEMTSISSIDTNPFSVVPVS